MTKINWVFKTGSISRHTLELHHNQPVILTDPPPEGDWVLAGMIPAGSATMATLEREHKLGVIDFKVVFQHLTTGKVSKKWHVTLDQAMSDFCRELMLDEPETAQRDSSKMIEQYSEESGCGMWS